MIALDKEGGVPVGPPQVAPQAKIYRYKESYGANILLEDLTQLDLYRSEHKENSEIYADVRIVFPDGKVLLLSVEEFIKVLRGPSN